jgi:hypothetical protein
MGPVLTRPAHLAGSIDHRWACGAAVTPTALLPLPTVFGVPTHTRALLVYRESSHQVRGRSESRRPRNAEGASR